MQEQTKVVGIRLTLTEIEQLRAWAMAEERKPSALGAIVVRRALKAHVTNGIRAFRKAQAEAKNG